MNHTLRTYLRLMLLVPFLRLFMLLEESDASVAPTPRPYTLNQLAVAHAKAILHLHQQDWLGLNEYHVWTGIIPRRGGAFGFQRDWKKHSDLRMVHVGMNVYLAEGAGIWISNLRRAPEGGVDEFFRQIYLSELYRELDDAELRLLMSGFELLQEVQLPLRTGNDPA